MDLMDDVSGSLTGTNVPVVWDGDSREGCANVGAGRYENSLCFLFNFVMNLQWL